MLGRRKPSAPATPPADEDRAIAAAIQGLVDADDLNAARERYGELVDRHQRRAIRIAYAYLRDAADADEAVQDAFVKAYTHLVDFDATRPFDVWFTRILVNGCLDRLKARARRERWLVSPAATDDPDVTARVPSTDASPEVLVLRRERGVRLMRAIDGLPTRQRTVVVLSQFGGHTTRDVSQMIGLSEATVRVHLFRALRRLREMLAGDPAFAVAGRNRHKSGRRGAAS